MGILGHKAINFSQIIHPGDSLNDDSCNIFPTSLFHGYSDPKYLHFKGQQDQHFEVF